jgi:hypothetical protein
LQVVLACDRPSHAPWKSLIAVVRFFHPSKRDRTKFSLALRVSKKLILQL